MAFTNEEVLAGLADRTGTLVALSWIITDALADVFD